MYKLFHRIWQDWLLMIAVLALLIASFFAFPKVSDINWATIESLTTLMLGVALTNHFHGLEWISEKLLRFVNNERQLTQMMCLVSFFAAMILTNDVSIITLVPIYLTISRRHHFKIELPVTLITIAANLGSSTMPFGNPQNLFLVNYYHFSFMHLLLTMMPLTLIGLLLILGLTCLVPRQRINFDQANSITPVPPKWPMIIIILLMILTFLAIFDVIPLPLMLIMMIIAVWIMNRKTLMQIDYGLLVTFICFFLTVGILSRLSVVDNTLILVMHSAWQQYFTALLSSQVISNVPAAILLAKFATNGNAILMGVNVAGLGTLVASLANLLAFKMVIKMMPEQSGHFLKTFTIVNVVLLMVLAIIGGIFI